MKADELFKHIICSVCHQPIGHTGLPLFWTIRVNRLGIKLDAVQRHDGLTMMMGSSKLAEILGTGEELAEPLMQPVELTVCETCMVERFPKLTDVALRSE